MTKRKQATDISAYERLRVHKRDGRRCAYCGRTDKPVELAHYISRTQGGRGIAENLVSLCRECHSKYDGAEREKIGKYLKVYLRSRHGEKWSETDLVYRKDG